MIDGGYYWVKTMEDSDWQPAIKCDDGSYFPFHLMEWLMGSELYAIHPNRMLDPDEMGQ